MAKIILPSAFRKMAWKNGGGLTHEIARADRDEALLWRLSIAEVESEGPFSVFPGLTRILTVIEGAGLRLETPSGSLEALPLTPVCFSGDWPIISRLIHGPIRDLNLIFDARLCAGRVSVVSEVEARTVEADLEAMFLCVGGEASSDGAVVPPGAVAFGRHQRLSLSYGARGIVVQLEAASR